MTKAKTPCVTCANRHFDEVDQVYYCGLSGKEIRDETTDEFEDEKAYCVNHAKRVKV